MGPPSPESSRQLGRTKMGRICLGKWHGTHHQKYPISTRGAAPLYMGFGMY